MSSGKVWIMIGVFMVVLGILLSVFFSVVSNKQIDTLIEKCEKEGGKATVEEGGFIFTTSFKFKCDN